MEQTSEQSKEEETNRNPRIQGCKSLFNWFKTFCCGQLATNLWNAIVSTETEAEMLLDSRKVLHNNTPSKELQ